MNNEERYAYRFGGHITRKDARRAFQTTELYKRDPDECFVDYILEMFRSDQDDYFCDVEEWHPLEPIPDAFGFLVQTAQFLSEGLITIIDDD